jgi:putative lipoic acid-binding regulatory protein
VACDHEITVRPSFLTPVTGLALLVTLVAWVVTAAADPQTANAEPAALVLQQLEALRAHDFVGAYALASRELRRNFSRGEFEWMVKRAHPEIASSSSAVVVRTSASGGYVYVTVHVQGRNGHRVEALYELVHERDGWKVNALSSRASEEAI